VLLIGAPPLDGDRYRFVRAQRTTLTSACHDAY
jgi:hypothetical protein